MQHKPTELFVAIRRLDDLNLQEKGAMLILASYGNAEGRNIWPSQEQLALDMKVTCRSVARYLNALQSKGHLVMVGKHGRCNEYALVLPGVTSVTPVQSTGNVDTSGDGDESTNVGNKPPANPPRSPQKPAMPETPRPNAPKSPAQPAAAADYEEEDIPEWKKNAPRPHSPEPGSSGVGQGPRTSGWVPPTVRYPSVVESATPNKDRYKLFLEEMAAQGITDRVEIARRYAQRYGKGRI